MDVMGGSKIPVMNIIESQVMIEKIPAGIQTREGMKGVSIPTSVLRPICGPKSSLPLGSGFGAPGALPLSATICNDIHKI
jgi:hypothetical protein